MAGLQDDVGPVLRAGELADAVLAAVEDDNPGKDVGSFGPPTYLAVQVMLNAIKLACNAGHGKGL